MQEDQFHLPDFIAPDFAQPELERADLATPGFTMPDPARPDPFTVTQLPLWPADLDRLDTNRPDPALPDLTEPELPETLTLPAEDAHVMPEPECAPDVVMQQRPGELDPAAYETLLASPDSEELPPHISYPKLYTTEDEMSARKRHLGMLELGLEQAERDER